VFLPEDWALEPAGGCQGEAQPVDDGKRKCTAGAATASSGTPTPVIDSGRHPSGGIRKVRENRDDRHQIGI
jgi:hypothetical protein